MEIGATIESEPKTAGVNKEDNENIKGDECSNVNTEQKEQSAMEHLADIFENSATTKKLYNLVKREIERANNKWVAYLDTKTVNILTLILEKNGDYFDTVETTILSIIKDNKVDLSDIPKLIKLVQQTYGLILRLKVSSVNKYNICHVCTKLILTLVIILTKEKCIIVENEQLFIDNMSGLLDACEDLMESKQLEKKAKQLWRCIMR